MKIPFSINEFLGVFRLYNETVWPVQIILNILAVTCIILLFKKFRFSGKIISAVLGFLWLWMGIVYHLIFFTVINNAAYIFGVMFILQGLLFFYYGFLKNRFEFIYPGKIAGTAGLLLFIYSLIIYPVLGYFSGHVYPQSPTFGLPCPTAIFTFGMILFLKDKIPFGILTIPLLWSIIGFTAALKLSIHEDSGLFAAGIITLIIAVISNRKKVITESK